MLSSNSTTFFVSLPSNVKDYPENRPNNFRVHLPKSLQFDGNWGCALQSIHFPYSWPQGVGIENGQWIEIHTASNSPIRIPIPENLFDSTEECVAFLNDLIAANISHIKKSRKRRSTEVGEERSLLHTALDRLRNRDPSPPRVAGEVSFESDTVRAPDPPPPLEEQAERRMQEEAKKKDEEATRAIAEAKKKDEEAKKKKDEEAKKKKEEEARKKKDEEVKKKKDEEAKKKKDEEAKKKKDEEEKKKREEAAKAAEARAKALAEAAAKKKKDEDESKKREEAAKAAEAHAKALAEAAAKKKKDDEAKKKKDEEEKKKREEAAKAAEVQARALAEAAKKRDDEAKAKPSDPPKEEEEEERSLLHTTLDRIRNRDPSPPRVSDEVPFENDTVQAPDPPPPLEEAKEEKSMAHTFIARMRGDDDKDDADASTTAVEVYVEPKSKERGVLKELWQTMTMDLSVEELRSSDAQIQARIDQQDYERMGKAPTKLEEKAKEETKVVEEEERSMAHVLLDRFRGDNDSAPSPNDNFIELRYLESEDRIELSFSPNIDHVSLSPQLNEVLGIFPNNTHLTKGAKTQKGADFSRGISAFAVCAKDLTEQMILGNRTHSLLRIVSIDGKHMPGMIVERIYDSPMFMRVMPREINEIEIELRTLDGKFVPFIYGTVIITLIFKKLIKY